MNALDNLKAVLEKVKGAVNDRDKFEQLLQKRLGSAFTVCLLDSTLRYSEFG